MTDFDRAIGPVLEHEGGYVNDPVDPGGETNYGISKRSYPDEDIASMTRERACELYYRDFWMRPGIGDLPWPVSGKVLDVAVNIGTGRAIRMLQACLCRLGWWVEIDGEIGKQTLGAASRVNTTSLVRALCRSQAERYERLIEKNPDLAKYRNGWAARAAYEPGQIAIK